MSYPEDDDAGNEDTRARPLQQDVRQRLEDGIRDEENGQRVIVFRVGHVEGLLQALNFGIADIGAVEEGGQVEQRQPRDQPEIQLPQQLSILQLFSN